jgi:hypothetical protein
MALQQAAAPTPDPHASSTCDTSLTTPSTPQAQRPGRPTARRHTPRTPPRFTRPCPGGRKRPVGRIHSSAQYTPGPERTRSGAFTGGRASGTDTNGPRSSSNVHRRPFHLRRTCIPHSTDPAHIRSICEFGNQPREPLRPRIRSAQPQSGSRPDAGAVRLSPTPARTRPRKDRSASAAGVPMGRIVPEPTHTCTQGIHQRSDYVPHLPEKPHDEVLAHEFSSP